MGVFVFYTFFYTFKVIMIRSIFNSRKTKADSSFDVFVVFAQVFVCIIFLLRPFDHASGSQTAFFFNDW